MAHIRVVSDVNAAEIDLCRKCMKSLNNTNRTDQLRHFDIGNVIAGDDQRGAFQVLRVVLGANAGEARGVRCLGVIHHDKSHQPKACHNTANALQLRQAQRRVRLVEHAPLRLPIDVRQNWRRKARQSDDNDRASHFLNVLKCLVQVDGVIPGQVLALQNIFLLVLLHRIDAKQP